MAPAPDDEADALPEHYDQAERLAASMLNAAMHGDWNHLRLLQRRIPALAADLDSAWQRLDARRPGATLRLEDRRIDSIRRVLQIDAQIRRLADPAAARLDDVFGARRPH